MKVTVGSLPTATECDREPFYEMMLGGFPSDAGMTLNQRVLRFVGFVTCYSLKENCNQNNSSTPEEMWGSAQAAEAR